MLQQLMTDVALGQVTWLNAAAFALVALAVGAAGGALGGVLVGGRHIGYGLAAMMGTFFGPLAALPGVLAALLVLAWV